MLPLRLVPRNLCAHPLRSALTLGSITLAVLILCLLRSMVVNLDAGVQESASNRLVVQSAVSLFVDLPQAYQPKIEQVDGVAEVCKMQYFGGIYQDRSNYFAQFAIDADRLLGSYPEIEVVEGSYDEFLRLRTGCLIGEDLAQRFDFEVGQTVPLIGTIFARSDGRAWEFQVAAIYRSRSANVDTNTMFFHYDYLDETLQAGDAIGPLGVGVYAVRLEDGVLPERVQADIDGLFVNGPQRVQTTTEAEFQRQFVSMLGNVPTLLQSIGGGVLFAILLAVLNTMLMAARERTRDLGVLKALGFTDATAAGLLLTESLLLCALGGLLGIGLVRVLQQPVREALSSFGIPGFTISAATIAMGIGVALGIGVVAAQLPAWMAARLRPVEALRAEH